MPRCALAKFSFVIFKITVCLIQLSIALIFVQIRRYVISVYHARGLIEGNVVKLDEIKI